jgi:hypothetical protein
LTTDAWSFDRLRTSRKGTVFAHARAAPATVLLPVTDRADTATAILDDGNVTIRAVVDADDLRLHPLPQTAGTGPVALLGIVLPTALGSMRWVSGTSDAHAAVSIDASPVVLTPSPVVDTVACDRLAIAPSDFEARALITKKAALPRRWTARDHVPIRRNVKAEPSAELAAGVEVEVLQHRGALAQILYETPTFLVVGWVSSKDLTTTSGLGHGFGMPGGGYVRPLSSFRGDTCANELPLVVEVGTERVLVGTIRAKRSFRIVEPPEPGRRRPEYVAVELPAQKWLALVAPARFVVASGDLARCAG